MTSRRAHAVVVERATATAESIARPWLSGRVSLKTNCTLERGTGACPGGQRPTARPSPVWTDARCPADTSPPGKRGMCRRGARTWRRRFSAALLATIDDAGFPADTLDAARQAALRPLVSTARAATRDLRRPRLDATAPADGRTADAFLVGIWQEVAGTVVPTLRRLRGLTSPTGALSVLADDIAELLDRLATRLYNESDRIDLMLDVSAAALEAAASDLVRENMRKGSGSFACGPAMRRWSVSSMPSGVDANAAARALDEARSHADDEGRPGSRGSRSGIGGECAG